MPDDELPAAIGAIEPADQPAEEPDDDWATAKASLADYDRTGAYVDANVALAQFRAQLLARLT